MHQLTPEVFNTLVIANMIVGLLLAAVRFTQDMRRPLPDEQREQEYDESSSDPTDETHPGNRG